MRMIRMNMKGKCGPGDRDQSEGRIHRVDPATLKGKHAYTAVVLEDGYGVGRADYGIPGYTPLKVAPYQSFEEAKTAANMLNKDLGLNPLEAWHIVADTMRGCLSQEEGS